MRLQYNIMRVWLLLSRTFTSRPRRLIKCSCGLQVRECDPRHKVIKGKGKSQIRLCTSIANLQKADETNFTITPSVCGYCDCNSKENGQQILTCNRCNEEYCMTQQNSTDLAHGNKSEGFIVCPHKRDECRYTLPSKPENDKKAILLRIHLIYFCLAEATENNVFKYQFCPFSVDGCSFNVGHTDDAVAVRAKIAEHLSHHCQFTLVKRENPECCEYVARSSLKRHMRTCSFSKLEY